MASDKAIKKIRKIFKSNRNSIFLVDAINGCEFKYGEIEELSLKLASKMKKAGIKKNDRVAVLLPNCSEFVVIYFACMQLGAISVPVNIKLGEKEIREIVGRSEPKAIFVARSLKPRVNKYIKLNRGVKLFSFLPGEVFDRDDKKTDSGIYSLNFFAGLKGEKPYPNQSFSRIKDNDTAIIVFTSGTTGHPKGVVISFGGIVNHGLVLGKILNLGQNSRFYGIMAMSYLGGFYNLMMVPLLSGASLVLDNTFNAAMAVKFWEKIIKHRVDSLWLVPSIISVLLSLDRSNEGAAYCKKNIKIVLAGTAPLPVTLKRKFEKKYSLGLFENYGLSETFILTTNSPGSGNNRGAGKELPGCKVKIIGEDGRVCKIGEAGEIIAKSKYMMKGYYHESREERKSLKNGYFYTGDIGYLDKDGYLYVTDRKKDMIIRGGINISPKEIEDVILRMRSIREAAVVGVPNELTGEEIAAVVSGRADLKEESIIRHCRRYLAKFKIPARVIFTNDFPRSVTGKIQKNVIKSNIINNFRNYGNDNQKNN